MNENNMFVPIFENKEYFYELAKKWEEKTGDELRYSYDELHAISHFAPEFEEVRDVVYKLDKETRDKLLFHMSETSTGLVFFTDEEDFREDPKYCVLCEDVNGDPQYFRYNNNYNNMWTFLVVEAIHSCFDVELQFHLNKEKSIEVIVAYLDSYANSKNLHDKIQEDMSKADKLVSSINPDAEAPDKKTKATRQKI
ncbi:hypothetical protein [Burkholderia contaminans]|uniref:hypothetical protein n=1 Tax=Burkholderia contaminans TaxID=488447 RepID=UPI00158CBA48|nr:hypothetical protein [Burkholderia contaminans]